MIRQTMKWINLALVVSGMLIFGAMTLSAAQQTKAHPVEGTYEVSATDSGGSASFLMIVKRNGEKWTCEFRDTPAPVTVETMTVDKENALTITGIFNYQAKMSIKGKFKDDKIEGTFVITGDSEGTWTATKRKP